MKLDIAAAERAIRDKVAGPLGMSIAEAAWGIRKILDSRMADLLRRMTLERGYDPRDFTLFANGGAGPSHAWVLAAELGLKGFVVPAAATGQSAFGTANSDLVFTTEHPVYVRIQAGRAMTEAEAGRVEDALRLAERAVRENLQAAAAGSETSLEQHVSLRFRGQSHHLDVRFEGTAFTPGAFARLKTDYQAQYEALFGKGASYSGAGFEVLSVRVTGIARLPAPEGRMTGDELTAIASRMVVFDDPAAATETRIYRTTYPGQGSNALGPCIIEYPGQSVVVPPGAQAHADGFGNLHVRFAA
jgi:N-methylhydantoinase A